MDLTMIERDGDRWEKMEGSCSTSQSPPSAVVPVEEEEEEEEEEEVSFICELERNLLSYINFVDGNYVCGLLTNANIIYRIGKQNSSCLV
jgi:hypothetical protein